VKLKIARIVITTEGKPVRLFDFHCEWLLQYATETMLFEQSAYGDVPGRLRALDGYLLGASAAILFCGRRPDDWARRADRWGSLGELIARYEAEFSGRLIIGPDDLARFGSEPADGLCWGMLGIGGLDYLVREPADLDRLSGAFERGVRVFQLVDCPDSLLGGSACPGDERSLSELGLAVLDRLVEIGRSAGRNGVRPVVDLAGLNAQTVTKVLDWAEHEAARLERLVLVSSCSPVAALAPDCVATPHTAPTAHANLGRFRALGGVIGVTPGSPAAASAEALRELITAIASVPYRGCPGYEGIGIGTDYFRAAALLPELADVSRVADWLETTFGSEAGSSLAYGAGHSLAVRAIGGAS
jgi:membrane dipeptidase